jgi:hypothetical protein
VSVCLLAATLAAGCSDEGATERHTTPPTGGRTGVGGNLPATGGVSPRGGTASGGRPGTVSGGSGGAPQAMTGGAPAGGAGMSSSGGSPSSTGGKGSASGGVPPIGGSAPTGGAPAQATGGVSGGGGSPPGGAGGTASGGTAAAAGSGGASGGGGTIDVKGVTTSCPGAVPGGVTATWCSCEQWGEKTVAGHTYYNNLWGSGPGPQCIWRADSGAWGVTASHPNGGGIKSYPNISVSPQKAISSIQSYTSSFDIVVPGAGMYDTAYDLWVKGTTAARIEIMLWMSYRGGAQPIATAYDAAGAIADATNVTVGGHTWNVYYGSNGANDVASFLRTSNTSTATVDIKAVLSWLIANNHSKYAVFTASYTLDQVQFGHEITSDSGAQAYVTRSFSVTSN